MSPQPQRAAYEIYEELHLGSRGYAVAPSIEARRGVQEAIRRKLGAADEDSRPQSTCQL
jgi:hypothetical protein